MLPINIFETVFKIVPVFYSFFPFVLGFIALLVISLWVTAIVKTIQTHRDKKEQKEETRTPRKRKIYYVANLRRKS